MRRWLGAAALLVSGITLAQSPVFHPVAENWQSVGATALPGLFGGMEFGDGVHFAYRFKLDGTFTGTEMAKDVSGSWQVRNGELCMKWRAGEEECYEVQQDGKQVRMLVNRSEAWYGTIQPLR